jgi:hypothetical protein
VVEDGEDILRQRRIQGQQQLGVDLNHRCDASSWRATPGALVEFMAGGRVYPPASVAESQSLTALSADAYATSLPSGEIATAQTQFEWPSSVRRAAPVAESQSLIVLSMDADATNVDCQHSPAVGTSPNPSN